MSRKRKVFISIVMLSVFFLFVGCGKKQKTTEQDRQNDTEQTETEDVVLPEDGLDDADLFSDENMSSDQYSDTSQEDHSLEYKEPSGNWSDTVGTVESPQEDEMDSSDAEDNEDEEQAPRQEIVFPEIDF